MKTYQSLLLGISILANNSSQAQFNRAFSGALRSTTEKVLSVFPTDLTSLQGDTLEFTENSIIFNTNVKPEGALETTFTKYQHLDENAYAWKAVMLRSDDFDDAAKKYKVFCQQLKNLSFRVNQQPVKMTGDIQNADGVKNFYSTVFQADIAALHKLRLEVLMENDMTEWTVTVLVYDRDHEDWEGSLVR